MEFKIASSRILRENYPSNWRLNWTIDTFHYALEPRYRFMKTTSIWQPITM